MSRNVIVLETVVAPRPWGALPSWVTLMFAVSWPVNLNAEPPVPLCVARHYVLLQLPLLPAAISTTAEIVGTTQARRAASWTRSAGLRELPLPEGYFSATAVAVNDVGQIAVNAYDQAFSRHGAFVFAGGVLHALQGAQSLASKITSTGDVAGEALDADGKTTVPVVWHQGRLIRVGGCCAGAAKGINRNGKVVGNIYDAEGRYHAFSWTAARGLVILTPDAWFSSALAVNDEDAIVVQTFPGILLYRNGERQRPELSKRFQSHPNAISNCGALVGAFGPYSDKHRAFVWKRESGFIDLNTTIDVGGDWTLKSAVDINSRGEIVGYGDHRGEEMQGFLLSPKH